MEALLEKIVTQGTFLEEIALQEITLAIILVVSRLEMMIRVLVVDT